MRRFLIAFLPTVALAIITQQDRDDLLALHNQAREQVSPPAANMQTMVRVPATIYVEQAIVKE